MSYLYSVFGINNRCDHIATNYCFIELPNGLPTTISYIGKRLIESDYVDGIYSKQPLKDLPLWLLSLGLTLESWISKNMLEGVSTEEERNEIKTKYKEFKHDSNWLYFDYAQFRQTTVILALPMTTNERIFYFSTQKNINRIHKLAKFFPITQLFESSMVEDIILFRYKLITRKQEKPYWDWLLYNNFQKIKLKSENELQPFKESLQNIPEPTSPPYQPEPTSPPYQPEPVSPPYQPEPVSPHYQPKERKENSTPTSPSYLPHKSTPTSPSYLPHKSTPTSPSDLPHKSTPTSPSYLTHKSTPTSPSDLPNILLPPPALEKINITLTTQYELFRSDGSKIIYLPVYATKEEIQKLESEYCYFYSLHSLGNTSFADKKWLVNGHVSNSVYEKNGKRIYIMTKQNNIINGINSQKIRLCTVKGIDFQSGYFQIKKLDVKTCNEKPTLKLISPQQIILPLNFLSYQDIKLKDKNESLLHILLQTYSIKNINDIHDQKVYSDVYKALDFYLIDHVNFIFTKIGQTIIREFVEPFVSKEPTANTMNMFMTILLLVDPRQYSCHYFNQNKYAGPQPLYCHCCGVIMKKTHVTYQISFNGTDEKRFSGLFPYYYIDSSCIPKLNYIKQLLDAIYLFKNTPKRDILLQNHLKYQSKEEENKRKQRNDKKKKSISLDMYLDENDPDYYKPEYLPIAMTDEEFMREQTKMEEEKKKNAHLYNIQQQQQKRLQEIVFGSLREEKENQIRKHRKKSTSSSLANNLNVDNSGSLLEQEQEKLTERDQYWENVHIQEHDLITDLNFNFEESYSRFIKYIQKLKATFVDLYVKYKPIKLSGVIVSS